MYMTGFGYNMDGNEPQNIRNRSDSILTSRSAKEIIPRSTAALICTKRPPNTNSSKFVMLLLPKIDNEFERNPPYACVSIRELRMSSHLECEFSLKAGILKIPTPKI